MASDNNYDAARHRLRFGDVAAEPLRMLPPIEGFQKMPLVSLEEAVEPLAKHVPNVARYASSAKVESEGLLKYDLSLDECASIRLYTMEWNNQKESLYMVLNEKLRSEDRSVLKEWFLYLKLIMTGLSKIPSCSELLLRGVKLNLSNKYQNGEHVIWWAFSSCTDSMKVVEEFCGKTGERTIFEIDCYSGKDVRHFSRFSQENEVLLMAATEFQVVSNVYKGNGLTVVHLKEIEPKYPLIEKESCTGKFSRLPKQPTVNRPIKTPANLPVIQSPKPTQSQPAFHQINRNPEIRRIINNVPPRSQMRIEGQRVNREDMIDIVQDVVRQKRINKMAINDAEITAEAISELGEGIQESTSLHEVDLSSNRFSSNDVYLLMQNLSVPRMHYEEQNLCCGLVKKKEVEGGPIKILNLSNNNIDDDGMKHLVILLRLKRTLTDLYLNHNKIGDKGVELLAKALSNSTTNLQKLYLSNNRQISDRSANHLVEMFQKNSSLNTLWLLKSGLSDTGRQRLIEAAASKRGFYLNIERCNQE